jgi:hypothetical protein
MPNKFNGKLEQRGNPDYSGELDQKMTKKYEICFIVNNSVVV